MPNIVCHVGRDAYVPPQPTQDDVEIALEAPNEECAVRGDALQLVYDRLERTPSVRAIDLLYLAITVQSADLLIHRSNSEDGWSRNISVHLAVSNPRVWTRSRRSLEEMLNFLTGDDWSLHFRPRERPFLRRRSKPLQADAPQTVCLFSGGLDSFCGAVKLAEEGVPTLLVGHYAMGVVHTDQARMFQHLRGRYGAAVRSLFAYIDAPSIIAARTSSEGEEDDVERERSRRSRSILFMALGLLVADAIGEDVPIVVPENGFISLNVPATPSRLGSLSTRTTHPYFLQLLRRALSEVGLRHDIQTPFAMLTKGEILEKYAASLGLCAMARDTNSCAHPEAARWLRKKPGTPCGYCVPCLVRRAAFRRAPCEDGEYCIDVLSAPPAADTDRGKDLRALQMVLARHSADRALFDVLASGPLAPKQARMFADVYTRGIAELREFLAQR